MARCRPAPTHLTDAELLRSVTLLVEQGCALGGGADVLVRVIPEQTRVQLGYYPIPNDAHPCAYFADLVAGPDWWAVGIVLRGTARFLDQAEPEPVSILATYFVERGGEEVSLLRRGDEIVHLPARAVGRIPDLCHSILGRT